MDSVKIERVESLNEDSEDSNSFIKLITCSYLNCTYLFESLDAVLQHIQDVHLLDGESTESSQSVSVATATTSSSEDEQGMDSRMFSLDYNNADPDTLFPFDDNYTMYSNEENELSLAIAELAETFDLEWIEEYVDEEGRLSLRKLESDDSAKQKTISSETEASKHDVKPVIPLPRIPKVKAVETEPFAYPSLQLCEADSTSEGKFFGTPSSKGTYQITTSSIVDIKENPVAATSNSSSHYRIKEEKIELKAIKTEIPVAATNCISHYRIKEEQIDVKSIKTETNQYNSTRASSSYLPSTYWADPKIALGLVTTSEPSSNSRQNLNCNFSTIDFTCITSNCPTSSVETKRKNAASTSGDKDLVSGGCKANNKGRKRKSIKQEPLSYESSDYKRRLVLKQVHSFRDLFDSPVKKNRDLSPSKITLKTLLEEAEKSNDQSNGNYYVSTTTPVTKSYKKRSKEKAIPSDIVFQIITKPETPPAYYDYDFIVTEGLKTGRSGKDWKPYLCPVPECDKVYKNPNGLKYHARYGHSPRQEFPCESCSKIYTTRHGLMAHMRAHLRET